MKKNYLFKWLRKGLALLLPAVLVFAGNVSAQTITITGKVTDSKTNESLPGVLVKIQNTTIATSTNIDGNYTIQTSLTPTQNVLEFSYLGYTTQTKTFTRSGASVVVNAGLVESAVGLDEVIVTGTSEGTTRRQLGNYVGTVSAEELNKGSQGNVLLGMQGKVVGAQISQNQGDPAGGISVRLRGISSIISSTEPLYIIDGVVANNSTTGTGQQNRLVDINPQDIERIEVLNGAAAAAIYGSRANAGVVQIFTKRGVSGEPVVSVSSTYMFSQLRRKMPVNQSPTKFGGPTDGPGAFTQDIITAPLQTTTTAVQRYDYQDYIFHDANGTDNNVSVSGGSDGTRYYVSSNYFKNQGIVRNTDFTRFGLRANIDQTLSKWAAIRGGVNYARSDANEKPYGNGLSVPVGSQWIIANFHDIWRRDAAGNLMAVGERGRVNPVSIIEDYKQKYIVNRVLANAGIKLFPVRNLTVDYSAGIDNAAAVGTSYVPPYAYNAGSASGGAGLDPTLNGSASKNTNNSYLFNTDLNVNYEYKITSGISATSQVGYSYQYENSTSVGISGRGMAPTIVSVGGASTPAVGSDGRSESSVAGAYFQQNFKFNNNFFLTGAIRLDGSSVFGPKQRNQLYKKASASYVLSDTKMWEGLNADWISVFKVRAAYGESGNLTGIGAYDRFNSFSPSSFLGKTSFAASSVQANETVKPERQNEIEVGTDLFFLKNRLGLTVNWYHKKVSDLLLNRQISPTNGFTSKLDNFGTMENRGIEVMLTATPVRTKDLNWNTTVIFNKNRNKAIDIGEGVTFFTPGSSAPTAIINGQPVGLWYGTYFARNADGSLLLTPAGAPQTERGTQTDLFNPTTKRNAAGQPTGDVLRKVIGNPNPDWNGSFVSELSYKKLSFRVQLDTEQGGNKFAADWRTAQGVGSGKVSELEQTGQLPRGWIAGAYNVEEWRVKGGDWVKLRDISLSYNLGSMKYVKDLTINLSGKNLYSWDNYEEGYDPETNSSGQSTLVRGVDFGAVPIPRTINFGIQAKF